MKHSFLINNRILHPINVQKYKYVPKNKDELKFIIENLFNNGETNLNCIDVSHITSMKELFLDISKKIKLQNFDVSEWDVSNVVDMESMFHNCYNFNCDISGWDVSNVTNMKMMFANCSKFNMPLNRWDVSNVENMTSMFYYCDEFNQYIGSWNISKVKYISAMFYCCSNYDQDLSFWDLKRTSKHELIFSHCPISKEHQPLIMSGYIY
ncbi:MAG: DUF285 domain-containing protein [Clostridia bacterium]|nr:DUF285 domain-containing protein [Clostridia bacterium]